MVRYETSKWLYYKERERIGHFYLEPSMTILVISFLERRISIVSCVLSILTIIGRRGERFADLRRNDHKMASKDVNIYPHDAIQTIRICAFVDKAPLHLFLASRLYGRTHF